MKREVKERHLHVRVADAQVERWQRAARRDNRSLSSWVTTALDAAVSLQAASSIEADLSALLRDSPLLRSLPPQRRALAAWLQSVLSRPLAANGRARSR